MTWKDILKMPAPIDTDTNRDTEFIAAITQYEKDNIEPLFTELINSQPAGTPVKYEIGTSNSESSRGGRDSYFIGTEDIEKLGNSMKFIMNTIKGIYVKEGYQVKDSESNNERQIMIKITKPQ